MGYLIVVLISFSTIFSSVCLLRISRSSPFLSQNIRSLRVGNVIHLCHGGTVRAHAADDDHVARFVLGEPSWKFSPSRQALGIADSQPLHSPAPHEASKQ
jgi:hypothetical protein